MRDQLTIICKHLTIILFVFALAMPSQINAQSQGSTELTAEEITELFGEKDRDRDGYSEEEEEVQTDPQPTTGGDSIPLDGGLSILVLGAAAFGIRKLRKK